jgi:hypothetical protein
MALSSDQPATAEARIFGYSLATRILMFCFGLAMFEIAAMAIRLMVIWRNPIGLFMMPVPMVFAPLSILFWVRALGATAATADWIEGCGPFGQRRLERSRIRGYRLIGRQSFSVVFETNISNRELVRFGLFDSGATPLGGWLDGLADRNKYEAASAPLGPGRIQASEQGDVAAGFGLRASARIATGILAVLLAPFFLSGVDLGLVPEPGPLYAAALAVASVCGLGTAAEARALRNAASWFAATFLFMMSVFVGTPLSALALFNANQALDTFPAGRFQVAVISKDIVRGARGGPYLQLNLEPWGPVPHAQKVNVSSAVFDAAAPGGYTCMEAHRGALRVPWVQACEPKAGKP